MLVCGSADDASSRTAPADGAESHLSSRLRDIAADVEANADYVIRLRRELHLVPELMWTEVKTSAIVKRELDAMGIAHAADSGATGILMELMPASLLEVGATSVGHDSRGRPASPAPALSAATSDSRRLLRA